MITENLYIDNLTVEELESLLPAYRTDTNKIISNLIKIKTILKKCEKLLILNSQGDVLIKLMIYRDELEEVLVGKTKADELKIRVHVYDTELDFVNDNMNDLLELCAFDQKDNNKNLENLLNNCKTKLLNYEND
jgi:hypothetical protein